MKSTVRYIGGIANPAQNIQQRAALYTTRVNPYAVTNSANAQLLIARASICRGTFSTIALVCIHCDRNAVVNKH